MKKILLLLYSTIILFANNDLQVSGFSTLGVTYNDNNSFIYRSDLTSLNGARGNASLKPLSNIGIQLDYKINDNFSTNIQTVYKDRNENDLSLEWANLKYTFDNNDFIRIGKMRIPLFLYSDILDVSYAYTWAHLPNEVYTSIISNYKGVEYTKNFFYDNFDFNTQFTYGDTANNEKIGFDQNALFSIKVKKLKGLIFNLQYDDIKIRASRFEGSLTMKNNDLSLLVNSFSSIFPTINPITNDPIAVSFSNKTIDYLSEKYSVQNDKITFSGLGFIYEKDFVISSEYAVVKVLDNVFVNELKAYYLNFGYQFNKYLPYILYAKKDQKSGNTKESLNGNPYEQTIFDTAFKDPIEDYLSTSNIAQKSISVGFKYDISPSMNIKTQYEKIFIDETYTSSHIQVKTNTNDMNLFHLSFNITF